MATVWREVPVPLAKGLQTKYDPRVLPADALAVAKDIEFLELGGIQTRKPYASIGTSILGGGTISDGRRLYANGDELLLFTKDTLYSWSARDSAWVSKGTHLAVKTTEAARFVCTAEQTTCDRAEVSNVILFAWEQETSATQLFMAAIDKTTGAMIMSPTQIGSGYSRPRILAMGDHFLCFFNDAANNTLWAGNVRVGSVAADTASLNEVAVLNTVFNDMFDCVKLTATTAAVVARRDTTTSYTIALVTSAAGAGSIPTVSAVTKARRADGPLAIALAPNNTHVQVFRTDETLLPISSVRGDYMTIAGPFTDVTTGQVIGDAFGPPPAIAAAYRSVQDGGQYRCYVYWSDQAIDGYTPFDLFQNYVDTGGTIGTASTFQSRLSPGSRAFDYNGSVYLWTSFAGNSTISGVAGLRAQLQNTYFLYRDDGFLVAKAAALVAGGHTQGTRGHLPNVQALSSTQFAWCGVERRRIPIGVGPQTDYAARSPRDITFEFDSNEARRCTRLGDTLYITGGEILQYDGQGLFEVGFHVYPYRFSASASGTGGVENGTYVYKWTWGWLNARGDRDRSTTATTVECEVTTGPDDVTLSGIPPLSYTHKTANPPEAEGWRTPKDPTVDTPFYKFTSNDPSDVTGDNCYVPNTPTTDLTVVDSFSDATLTTKETNNENGGVLENLAPLPARIIASTQERVFLAGVAGDPHRVWYSKLRSPGEVAAFHDALTIDVPQDGGDITAIAVMDEVLYVFRETSVYAIPGEGFDNGSGGQNYGPARRLASDVGAVSPEAVALTPSGLIFKASKGWHLLDRGGQVRYIGAPVAAFDADTVYAIHVVESSRQIRCLTSGRLLVLDYEVGEWSEWTVTDGLHAAIWNGTYHYLATASVKAEQSTYSSLTYGIDVETAWLKVADHLQGFQRVQKAMFLGEYRSTHSLRIRVAYDYDESDALGVNWVDDRYWTVDPTTVGAPEQVRFGPSRPKCQAIKFRITAVAVAGSPTPPTGEALKLTGISLKVGLERGLYHGLPAAQKE